MTPEEVIVSIKRHTPISLYAMHYEHVTDSCREERLHRILTKYLPAVGPSPSRVLDMGCGIGQITNWLFRAGYDVSGIDSSEEMQIEAQRRFPKVEFVNGDLKDYAEADVHNIICFGETLNYLGSYAELCIALRRIASNLCSGGRLIAEMLDPQDLEHGWSDSTRLFKMEDGWVAIFDYATLGGNCGQWSTRWLRRESDSPEAESHSFTTILNTWTHTEIFVATTACGFKRARVLDLIRGGPAREGTMSQLLIAEKV
jgi:SAM-dependent methyltransferase